jgi:RNA polymerase sigma factor (sigma-70 family)
MPGSRLTEHRIGNVAQGFRPLSDAELDRLDNDALIAHIGAARGAGRPEDAERALGILVFRHLDDVRRRVSIKVPLADVEDVAMEAVTSAIRAAFDGSAVGQFRAWLNRIVRRRIADHYRRAASRPEEAPLPEEHSEAEEIWGRAAISPDETGLVDLESVVDEVLEGLSDVHRRVVELFVFEDLPARETADEVNAELGNALDPPMSVDNVNQITSRFRRALRARLEGG